MAAPFTPRAFAAATMAAVSFVLYHATLLPGFDFGDTGFFQATAGSATITPRNGYPLYFAIGNLFLWFTKDDPAHAFNLITAIEGAAACGVLVLIASELAGSLIAGLAAALLFSVSYTFWSQTIIAEVYSLHVLCLALTLWLLLRWADRPTAARLAVFFAACALAFGNHLSMILLAPGYVLFLLLAAPNGWRSLVQPRVIAMASGIAIAGSLQYGWNLRGLWTWPNEPASFVDALRTFWFDVTKADWRDTMVLRVPDSMVRERLAMYGFDLFQQFGSAALLAPLGLMRLFAVDWRRALLMLTLFVANALFAFTYNVGDTHVFYLPSHAIVACLIAPGIVFAAKLTEPVVRGIQRRHAFALAVVASVVFADGAVRMYRDYPALDRSDDRRPADVMARLTAGIDDQHAILLADLNWQLVNGLAYYGKVVQPDLAYAWMPRVLLYAPALIRDNLAEGRDVALTARARTQVLRAYGPLVPIVSDSRVRVPTLVDLVRNLPRGTRYALCVLAPSPEFPLDRRDLQQAISVLTGGTGSLPPGDYAAIVGLAGDPPALATAADRPFRKRVEVSSVAVEVRMESWLMFDTIRRMGFGQIVAAHRHTLIVERGVSFAAFERDGRPLRFGYAANIFAPQERYLVRR